MNGEPKQKPQQHAEKPDKNQPFVKLTEGKIPLYIANHQSLNLNAAEVPSHSPTRNERRKQARPAELLAAALELFVEKGFAATRVEEVAARAGVSKGTLFLYFPSKQELFKAVVRENISAHFKSWKREVDACEDSSADLLRRSLYTWWQRVGAGPASGLSKLMVCEANNFPELATFYRQEVMQPRQTLMRGLLQRGIDRGEFRPMNLDHVVYSIFGAMQFLILSRHAAGVYTESAAALDAQDYIASYLDLLLHGLQATPAAP